MRNVGQIIKSGLNGCMYLWLKICTLNHKSFSKTYKSLTSVFLVGVKVLRDNKQKRVQHCG